MLMQQNDLLLKQCEKKKNLGGRKEMHFYKPLIY